MALPRADRAASIETTVAAHAAVSILAHESTQRTMQRRRYLSAIAIVATTTIAGCSGGDGSGSGTTDGETAATDGETAATDESTPSATETATDTATATETATETGTQATTETANKSTTATKGNAQTTVMTEAPGRERRDSGGNGNGIGDWERIGTRSSKLTAAHRQRRKPVCQYGGRHTDRGRDRIGRELWADDWHSDGDCNVLQFG